MPPSYTYFVLPYENVPEKPLYAVWYSTWVKDRPADEGKDFHPMVVGVITESRLPAGAVLLDDGGKAATPPPPPLWPAMSTLSDAATSMWLKLPSADPLSRADYFVIPFKDVPTDPSYTVWFARWSPDRPIVDPGMNPPMVVGVTTEGRLPAGAVLLGTGGKDPPPPPPPPPPATSTLSDYKTSVGKWLLARGPEPESTLPIATRPASPSPSAAPSSRALVVGVSKYHHIGRLPTTKDVPGVRDVLADRCGYPLEQIHVLDEDNATRDNILKALEDMCESSKAAGSRTFFYFSGHGGQGPDGSAYILPVDARNGQYPTTAISARDLSRCLDACSGELTVVLDCCRAAGMMSPGVIPDPAIARDGRDVELAEFADSLRNDIQSDGRVVFAASGAMGKAFGSPDAPYGIFTGYMLDGLRGSAAIDGGDITVDQLFEYVQKRVVLSSGEAQRPLFIATTHVFYPLTRGPHPAENQVVFEKDVFISYDDEDELLKDWVNQTFQPELEKNGLSIWEWDDVLGRKTLNAKEAIKKSRFTIVLLTASYLKDCLEEFDMAMAVLDAVKTRTPRFIPILRELCDLPLDVEAFVGLDMTPQHEMRFRRDMDRLIKHLKKGQSDVH